MLALVGALFFFRHQITSGIALIMNQFHDEAELAQAYLYDRMHVGSAGDEDPYGCMHIATMWIAAILYLVAALPPANIKRAEVPALAAISMLMFAYYGLIPSWIFIALLAAALILALSRGSALSSIAVLLVTMIAFGAVMMIDPGENYGISRADENFRDRFALKSAYLQSGDSAVDDLSTLEQDIQNKQNKGRDDNEQNFFARHRGIFALSILLAVLAVLAAAALLCMRCIRRRQAANRAGIDSDDPKEAIIAMFPYSVKWLQLAGLEPQGKPFTALIPMIRADVSEDYGDRFSGMYELWEEAAYSDHEMTEESREEMDLFMNDTIDMIREESSLRSKVVNTFRYAL
jgi:FtsH-binding integral membrane protein